MKQLHASGEDYLEAILVLKRKKGMVRSVDVARHLEVVIGLVYRLEHILAEACVFKQKSELDRFHSSFLRSNNHRFFLDRAVFWLW